MFTFALSSCGCHLTISKKCADMTSLLEIVVSCFVVTPGFRPEAVNFECRAQIIRLLLMFYSRLPFLQGVLDRPHSSLSVRLWPGSRTVDFITSPSSPSSSSSGWPLPMSTKPSNGSSSHVRAGCLSSTCACHHLQRHDKQKGRQPRPNTNKFNPKRPEVDSVAYLSLMHEICCGICKACVPFKAGTCHKS